MSADEPTPAPDRAVEHDGVLRRTVAAVLAWRSRWYATPTLLVATFLFLAGLPLTLDAPVLGPVVGSVLSVNLLVVTLVWAIAGQGWNVLAGYVGRFSFGHAAFFGLGAYAPIVLAAQYSINPWVGLLAGAVLAGLYALLIGVLTFRFDVRGSYFVLATLAFAELLLAVFSNVDDLGGASGFVKPLPSRYGADYGLGAFQFQDQLPYYYVGLGLLLAVTLVAVAIKHSGAGLSLFAIREDEDAASAVGIPTMRYKLLALVVSAVCTAAAGTLWGMYFTTVRPSVVFGVLVNLEILVPAVVGGLGSVFGPIVGALGLTVASEIGRSVVDVPELQDVVYGVILLVVVLQSPGGMVTLPGKLADRLAPSRRSGDDSGEGSDDGDEAASNADDTSIAESPSIGHETSRGYDTSSGDGASDASDGDSDAG